MSDGVERRNLIQVGGLLAGAAVAAVFADRSALASRVFLSTVCGGGESPLRTCNPSSDGESFSE